MLRAGWLATKTIRPHGANLASTGRPGVRVDLLLTTMGCRLFRHHPSLAGGCIHSVLGLGLDGVIELPVVGCDGNDGYNQGEDVHGGSGLGTRYGSPDEGDGCRESEHPAYSTFSSTIGRWDASVR